MNEIQTKAISYWNKGAAAVGVVVAAAAAAAAAVGVKRPWLENLGRFDLS